MVSILLAVGIIGLIIKLIYDYHKPKKTPKELEIFRTEWRTFLLGNVDFYNRLNQEERVTFENDILDFLTHIEIRGSKCKVLFEDKLLVASSAVIPLFSFPGWKYTNLDTVILLPNRFDLEFNTAGPDRNILGVVGTGRLKGVMHLSLHHLRLGFANKTDRKNVGIHEFTHLIDMMDGTTDGVPKFMVNQPASIPWVELILTKIEDISEKDSDINPYGGTNKIEFFAVASEYFFESPRLLKKKHPELYQLMQKAFNHDYANRKLKLIPSNSQIGRNDPCPCGSNKKYKHCCLE